MAKRKTLKVRPKAKRSVWILGHLLNAGEYADYLADFERTRKLNPDWTQEYVRRRALNNVMFVQKASSHAKERLEEAFRRLTTIGHAIQAHAWFPYFSANDSLKQTGVGSLRYVTKEIAQVHSDMVNLANEIEGEVGKELKVEY